MGKVYTAQSEGVRLPVTWNDKGHPIEPGKDDFVGLIDKIVRDQVPITCNNFRHLPRERTQEIWEEVEKVAQKLDEACLMLPNKRPLVIYTEVLKFEGDTSFVGHLAIDKARRQIQREMYNEAMLHTSFARLLGPPKMAFKATVSELWYVEEYDVLAHAVNGKMKIRKFQMHRSEV